MPSMEKKSLLEKSNAKRIIPLFVPKSNRFLLKTESIIKQK